MAEHAGDLAAVDFILRQDNSGVAKRQEKVIVCQLQFENSS